MDEAQTGGGLGETLKGMGRAFASVAGNRAELLLIEVQEERDFSIQMLCVAMVAVLFGVFATVAISAAAVFYFWADHPVAALVVLGALYGGVSLGALRRLRARLRDHRAFPASLEEVRKDREWLHRDR